MLAVLWVLEIIVGVLLVLAVLMQVVREGVLGSMFGGGAQAVFGPKGPTTLLEKITVGLIGLFFIITISIAKMSAPSPAPERLPEAPSPKEALPEIPEAPAPRQTLPPAGLTQPSELTQPFGLTYPIQGTETIKGGKMK